jgi:hypothetical protein
VDNGSNVSNTKNLNLKFTNNNTVALETSSSISLSNNNMQIFNSWSNVKKGCKFRFYDKEGGYYYWLIKDTDGGYTNEDEFPPSIANNYWWTTHQDSPFAEFYIDVNDPDPGIKINQSITFYPINSEKYIWCSTDSNLTWKCFIPDI